MSRPHRRSSNTRREKELELALGLTGVCLLGLVAVMLPQGRLRPQSLPTVVAMAAGLAVVWALALLSLRLRNARRQTLDQLQALTPTQFEDWVAARFRELGYKVRLTGMGGDHGADLLAEKPGERAIVQCKRYTSWSVGEPVLRDLYGAMHDFQAQRCYLVTTGQVTGGARTWARGKAITIWDGGALARMASASAPAGPESLPPTPAEQPVPPGPTCPRCGALLVPRRNSKTGEPFLGCSRFPNCRHTQPLDP